MRNFIPQATFKLEIHRYYAIFFKCTVNGVWRKWDQVGNAEVAIDIANMFTRLGHRVKFDDRTESDSDE